MCRVGLSHRSYSQRFLRPPAFFPRWQQLDLILLPRWRLPRCRQALLTLLLQHLCPPRLRGLGQLGPHLLPATLAKLIPGPTQLGADLAAVHKAHDASTCGFLLGLGEVDFVRVVDTKGSMGGGTDPKDVFPGARALEMISTGISVGTSEITHDITPLRAALAHHVVTALCLGDALSALGADTGGLLRKQLCSCLFLF